jgi:hypothetical protein
MRKFELGMGFRQVAFNCSFPPDVSMPIGDFSGFQAIAEIGVAATPGLRLVVPSACVTFVREARHEAFAWSPLLRSWRAAFLSCGGYLEDEAEESPK